MCTKVKVDVLVVGSCNIDMHWFTTSLPKPGETILGTNFKKGFGGKGANEAVAASRLGGSIALIAMVGNDIHGKDYLDHLKINGIMTDFIGISEDSSTGMACVTIDKYGENFIVVIPGANYDLTLQRVNAIFKGLPNSNSENGGAHSQNSSLEAKVLITQREVPDLIVLESLKWAKGHYYSSGTHGVGETVTIFNPSPIREDERDKLYASHIFDYCDILCLNEVEAGILTAHLPDDAPNVCSGQSAQNDPDTSSVDSCKVALGKLMRATKVGAVVLTIGKHGVLFAERKSPDCVKHVVSPKVEAVDTSGAGDSFLGSLAYYHAIYPDLDLHQKINRACYISAQTVKKHGTQASYPRRSSLPGFLF